MDTVSHAFAVRAQLINLTGQVTTDGIETDTLSSIENAHSVRAFFSTNRPISLAMALANILDGGSGGFRSIFRRRRFGHGVALCNRVSRPDADQSCRPRSTTNGIDTDSPLSLGLSRVTRSCS